MRVFKVDEPVFKTEPLFVLGCSHRQLARYMRRRRWPDVGEDGGQLGQMFTFTRPPWRLIWTKRPELPVVLHEVFHLVTRICADRGVGIRAHYDNGDFGDEPAAFLFEFFTRAVLKNLGRRSG